ncbi:Abhydrolase-1 multi-domain protein, partial [Pyrenophora tritici-repentis]
SSQLDLLVDISAGRAFESWQHSSGQMWLRDHLPDDVKGTRILLWRQGSKLRDCNSHLTTQNLQDVFLEDLLKLLQTQEVRPLVLIGHSLGGIIIKATFVKASQVQEYASLYEAIHGLVFFVTPHDGMETAHCRLRNNQINQS